MQKNSRTKAGLSFGITMAVFNIGWNLATESDHSMRHVIAVVVVGLISGALAGLLFGWLIGLFSTSKFVAKGTKIETAAGETVLFETPANHFKGIEAVGGKLYMTNLRLVFKSHKLNLQNHELSISLGDITSVERYKTMGIVNNGLSVITSQNTKEKFVVEQVEEWVRRLDAI